MKIHCCIAGANVIFIVHADHSKWQRDSSSCPKVR